MSDLHEKSVFERVGGEPIIRQLVDVFYEKVVADAPLRSIFPEDLEEGKEYQYLFIMQLFGGPTVYSQQRGHPRLRMRHMPFVIDRDKKDRWLKHMLDSIDEVGIQDPERATMREYFVRAAEHMINRD